MRYAIETDDLTRFYRSVPAVQGLTWKVPAGTAWAFLGPNGAGKSTTLKMLMGFVPPTRGSSRLLGEDPWSIRPETKAGVGYVAERPSLPTWMRVDEILRFHSGFYPGWRRDVEHQLRETFGLRGDARISSLSKGMHSSLMILLALCQGSRLLLLDEPAAALDVEKRRLLLSLLADFLTEEEHTLIFSTHIVTDVERIASHVAVIARGRLVECSELEELQGNVKAISLPVSAFHACKDLLARMDVLSEEAHGTARELVVRRYLDVEPELRSRLGPDALRVRDLSLEDIYLALVGAGSEVRV